MYNECSSLFQLVPPGSTCASVRPRNRSRMENPPLPPLPLPLPLSPLPDALPLLYGSARWVPPQPLPAPQPPSPPPQPPFSAPQPPLPSALPFHDPDCRAALVSGVSAYRIFTGSAKPSGMFPPTLSRTHCASATEPNRTRAAILLPGVADCKTLTLETEPYCSNNCRTRLSSEPAGSSVMYKLSEGGASCGAMAGWLSAAIAAGRNRWGGLSRSWA
mmetsp:Transcript_41934/g.126650  ORF Transcript_41934/g.126650 Transcript_41934/m.126650 type:complete len:217 (+) Transcript_41934:478-1128(+)